MLFAEHKFPVESLVQWLQRTENLKVKEIDYNLPLYQLLCFAHYRCILAQKNNKQSYLCSVEL
jgi:hypothetical protein